MLDLESFAYSAPFGIGPIGQYALTGQVSIDPVGYLSWGAFGSGVEFALFGTTKMMVYGPAIGSALFGELGLFTVLPGLGSAVAATSLIAPPVTFAMLVHSKDDQITRNYSRGNLVPQGRPSF